MADKVSKPEFVNVVPVTGKFCEFKCDGRTFKIWKVHPSTPDKYGTPIPYDVAVSFLAKSNPIISVVAVGKDGKKVNPILDEDKARIKQALALGPSYKNYNKVTSVDAKAATDALNRALDVVSQQEKENAKLQAALDAQAKTQEALLQRLSALESASAK